jgi:hypothetical protein
MTLTGGFELGPTHEDHTLLSFTIPGWQNPKHETGINGTGKFNITIYTHDDKEMYRFNHTDAPWFRITDLRKPKSIWYTRNSYQNGVQTSFEMNIEPINDLYPGNLMSITLPYPVHFTRNSKCIGNSYWIKGDMNCTLSQTLD